LEEEVFYGIFAYMFKERETLNEALMTWENNGRNQCKLVVISKF
jgi:hypothetical protein